MAGCRDTNAANEGPVLSGERCRGVWLLVVAVALVVPGFVAGRANAQDSADGNGGSVSPVEAQASWSTLRYLPRDAYFVAGIRPRDLLHATELEEVDRALASLVEYSLGRRLGVSPADVEEVVVVGASGGVRLGDYNAIAVVELSSRDATNRLMNALFGSEFDEGSGKQNSLNAVVTVRRLAGVLLGESTVLLGQPSVLQNWSFPVRADVGAVAAERWPLQSATSEGTHAFAVFDVERLRRFAPRFDDWMLSEQPWLAAASPVLRETRRLEVVCSGADGLSLVTTISANREALPDIDGTLRASATILRNVLAEASPKLAEWSQDAARPTVSLVRELLRQPSVEVLADSETVRLTVKANGRQLESFRAVLKPLANSLEVSARRALRSRNLQRIASAALDYYEDNKHLPLPIATDSDSGVPHSWRVTLLPYLGEQALFERYRHNEPWSSPANQVVLRQMPDVYRHVDDSPTSYRSAYYGLVGPETAFGDGRQPVRLRDIRDGTSNTILVVEARQGVPWTMPSDIEVVPGRSLPSIGGFDPEGALVGQVDTAVSFLPTSLPDATFRAFVTRAGGERISLP